MDMKDEILEKLNGLGKEQYAEFEYDFEMMAKTGDHTDAL